MTVAPELPPALDRRPAEGARPARAARRRTRAPHPTGAVAPRPTPAGPPVASGGPVAAGPAARTTNRTTEAPRTRSARPAGPGTRPGVHGGAASRALHERPARTAGVVLPGPRLPARADLDPLAVVAPPPEPRTVVELFPEPGAGTAGQHHPAVPGRLRVTGTRVVRPARPPVRLTVRGRLLVALLAALAVVVGMLLVTSRVSALREPASPVPASAPAAVVVEPGETLWSIAERVAPQRDPRVVVDQLRRINGLPSADVQAGQRLLLRAP